jgi:hypothetical protein
MTSQRPVKYRLKPVKDRRIQFQAVKSPIPRQGPVKYRLKPVKDRRIQFQAVKSPIPRQGPVKYRLKPAKDRRIQFQAVKTPIPRQKTPKSSNESLIQRPLVYISSFLQRVGGRPVPEFREHEGPLLSLPTMKKPD